MAYQLFVGYLMPKPFSKKNSNKTYLKLKEWSIKKKKKKDGWSYEEKFFFSKRTTVK